MQKQCVFISRRTGEKCSSKVVYLDSFCEKHKTTAQAALMKKELVKKNPIPISEPLPINDLPLKEVPKEIDATLKEPQKEETNVEISDDGVKRTTIFRNSYGRFEEPETHIVFDKASEKAFAVQNKKTGDLQPLTSKHLEICKSL